VKTLRGLPGIGDTAISVTYKPCLRALIVPCAPLPHAM